MKRAPLGPSIPLETALELVAPLKPGTGRPSEHSLPGFHSNVYARLLAAKPKMDLLTRRVYPSSMLTRIGINANKFDAVSSMSRVSGPRLWVSSWPGTTSVPKEARGRLIGKSPALASFKLEAKYRPDRVLLADLRLSLELYMRFLPEDDRAIVCYTKPCNVENGLVLDISQVPELMELSIPDAIRHGKHGLYLAGNILKYLHIYGTRSSPH